MKRLSITLGATLWVIAPAVALFLLWQQAGAVTLVEEKSMWTPVSQAPTSVTQPAEIAVSWRTIPAVLAPSWEGTVQEVLIRPGDELTDLTAVALIENVTREVWVTETPFFRPIEQGDSGPDVGELNKKLKARGLADVEGSKATLATALGIEKLAEKLGADKTRVFDPAWVVFLREPGVIADLTLTVGAPAPPEGQELITLSPEPGNLTLVGEGSVTVPDASGPEFGAVTPPASFEIEVSEDQFYQLGQSDSVHYGAIVLEVDLETRQLSKASRSDVLANISPTDLLVPVIVSTPIEDGAVAVPLGALVHDASGSCVIIKDAETHRIVPVTEVTTGAGKSVVVGAISTVDHVQIPPDARPSCS